MYIEAREARSLMLIGKLVVSSLRKHLGPGRGVSTCAISANGMGESRVCGVERIIVVRTKARGSYWGRSLGRVN
jgi:hypothetical protein